MYVKQMNGDLFSLFQERKENFISSLQRSLSVVASDKMISQMFADHCSASFVPDRIIELIRQILYDDREYFISQTIKKLSSIEACFSGDTLKDIEAIGLKIIDLSSNQAKEEEKSTSLFLFKEQLKKLSEKYNLSQPNHIIKPNINSKNIKDLKKSQDSFKEFYIESTKNIIKIIRKAKEKSIIETQNLQNTILLLANENKKNKKENAASQKRLKEIIQERDKILNQTGGTDTAEFIENMKKETEHSYKQRDVMNEQIIKLKEMNNQLLTATQNLNKELKSAINEKKTIENQFNQLQQEADSRLNEIKLLKQDQQTQFQEFQSKINKIKNMAEKTVINSNNEIQILKNSATNDFNTIQSMTSQIQSLNNNIKKEKDRSDKLVHQISLLEDNNQKSKQTILNLKNKIELLTKENKSIRKDNESILSSNKTLTELNHQITEKTNAISELKTQIFEKDSQIANLAKESSISKVSEVELNNLRANNKSLLSKIDELNHSIKKLQFDLENKSLIEKSYKERIDKLSKENENLEKLKVSNQSTIETLRSIKISNDGKSGQLEILAMQNEELVKKNQLIETELENLQNLNKKLRMQLNDNSQSITNVDDSSSTNEISIIKQKSKSSNKLKKENRSLKKSLVNLSQERDEIFDNLVSFRDQLYEELEVQSDFDLLMKIRSIKENESLISQICKILNISNSSMIPIILKHEKDNMNEMQQLLNVNNDESVIKYIRKNASRSQILDSIDNDISVRILNRVIPMLKIDDIEKVPERLHQLIMKEADNSLIINQILKLMVIDDQSQIITELHSLILKDKEKSDTLHRIFNAMNSIQTTHNVDTFQANDSFAFVQKIKDIKKNSDDYKKILFQTNCSDLNEFQKVREKYENDSKTLQRVQAIFSIFDDNDELVEKIIDLRDWFKQSCKILTINEDNNDTKNIVNSIQQLKIDLIDTQNAVSEKEETNQKLENQLTEIESQLTEISGFVTNQKSRSKDLLSLRSSIVDSNKRTENLLVKLDEKDNIIKELQNTVLLNQDEISQLKHLNEKAKTVIINYKKKKKLKRLKKENSLDLSSSLSFTSKQSIQNQEDNSISFDAYNNNNNGNFNEKAILKSIGSLLNSTDPNEYINEIQSLKSQVDFMNEQLNAISLTVSIKSTDSVHLKIDQIMKDYNISNSIFDKLYRILNVSSKNDIMPAISDLNKQLNTYKQKERMLIAATNANSEITLLSTVKEMSQAIETIKNNFDLSSVNDVIDLGELYSLFSVNNLAELKSKMVDLKEKEAVMIKVKDVLSDPSLDLSENDKDGFNMIKSLSENNTNSKSDESDLYQLPSLISDFLKFHSKSQIRMLCKKLNVDSYSQFIDRIAQIYGDYSKIADLVGADNLIETIENLVSEKNSIIRILKRSNLGSNLASEQIEDKIQQLIKIKEDLANENKRIKEDFVLENQRIKEELSLKNKKIEEELLLKNKKIEEELLLENQRIKNEYASENQKIKEELSLENRKIQEELTLKNQEIQKELSIKNQKIKDDLLLENQRIKEDLNLKDQIINELTAENKKIKEELTAENQKIKEELTAENQKIKEELTAENKRIKEDLGLENQKNKEECDKENQKIREQLLHENQKIKDELSLKNHKIKEELLLKNQKIKEELSLEKQKIEEELTLENKKIKEELTLENKKIKKELTLENKKIKEELVIKNQMIKDLTEENQKIKDEFAQESERIKEDHTIENQKIKNEFAIENKKIKKHLILENQKMKEELILKTQAVEELSQENQKIKENLKLKTQTVIDLALENQKIKDEFDLENQQIKEEFTLENQRIREEFINENQRIKEEYALENQKIKKELILENQKNKEEYALENNRIKRNHVLENQKIKDDLNQKIQIVNHLTQENKKIKEDLNQRNQTIKDLSRENQKIKDDLNQKIKTIRDDLNQKIKTIKDELNLKIKTINDLTQENQTIKEDLNLKIQALNDLAQENQKIKEDLNLKSHALNDLTQENQKIIDEFALQSKIIEEEFTQENQKIKDEFELEKQRIKDESFLENEKMKEEHSLENQKIKDDLTFENIKIKNNFAYEHKKLKEILNVDNDSEIQSKLIDVTQTYNFFNKLVKKLMKNNESKLGSLLSSKNLSEICLRVQKVTTLINSLKNQLFVNYDDDESENDIENDLNMIINSITKEKEIIFGLSSLLDCSSSPLDLNEVVDKCKVLLSADKDLNAFIHEIENGLSDLINVRQLKDSDSSNDKEYIRVLLQKVNSIFVLYKKLSEESQSIVNKALSCGFVSNSSLHGLNRIGVNSVSVLEAFNFVVDNEVKMEKQRNLMENHKSLSDLRQIADKERKIAENQKQKALLTIQQLRKSVTDEKEAHKQIQQKLLEVKQKYKHLQSELDHQKEINKSLNSLINNGSHNR